MLPFLRLPGFAAMSTCFSMAHAASIPTDPDGFTRHVAQQMSVQPLGGATVAIKSSLTLAVGDLQANLDRIHAFCRQNQADCPQEIERYVNGVVQVLEIRNAAPAPAAVRLAVRPVQYLQQLQNAGENRAAIHSWPLAGDLVIVPVLDSPKTIRMLMDHDYRKLALDKDALYRLGVANLAKELAPLMDKARIVPPGAIGHLAGESYETSRLALHDSWAPLAKAHGGELIVSAPAKDLLLYIGENTPSALDALRTLSADVMRRAPGPLSATLLRWTPAGWEVVR